jgi:DNA mismatch endonuclease, patch repair protein
MDERLKNKTMQAVRSKNTKLELAVTKELWKRGIRFRKNVSGLFGKPDIAIKKHKIVIFIDSCFWHGCELHCRLPKKNEEFWIKKIKRNKERDKEVTNYYIDNGWNILRIWEHELNENFNEVINTIERFIETNKKR